MCAGFDGAQLAAMEGHRVTSDAAAAWAGGKGWQATQVAYAAEGQAAKGQGTATQAEKRAGTSAAAGLLGRFSSAAQSIPLAALKSLSRCETLSATTTANAVAPPSRTGPTSPTARPPVDSPRPSASQSS